MNLSPSYHFKPISSESLEAMDAWVYGEYFPDFDMKPYHFSSARGDDPLVGPAGCDGFAVFDDNDRLAGLFEYYFDDNGTAAIGLALRPDQTNRGLGRGFLEAGIAFLVNHYDYQGEFVYLDVASGNQPALKLYERSGFTRVPGSTSGDEIRMRRRLSPS